MEPNGYQPVSSKKETPLKKNTSLLSGIIRLPAFRETILIIAAFILLIGVLQYRLFPQTLDIKIGQPSAFDIKTPRDIIDPEATLQARNEAARQALTMVREDPEYQMIDPQVATGVTRRLGQFFEALDRERELSGENESGSGLSNINPGKYQPYFEEIPRAETILQLLKLKNQDYQILKERLPTIAARIELQQRIDLRNLGAVRLESAAGIDREDPPFPDIIRNAVQALLVISLKPNLIPDNVKLTRLEQAARQAVPSVTRRKDSAIIVKNQIISANDVEILDELHLIVSETKRTLIYAGLALFVLILLAISLVYIFQFFPDLFRNERLIYLVLLITLTIIGLIKAFSLSEIEVLPYLAPISLGTMLIAILINRHLAIALGIIISLLSGIVVRYDLALAIFYFISSTSAVLALQNFQRQRDLVRCGWLLMVVNPLTVICLNLLFRISVSWDAALFAALNGFLAAVLCIGSLPFIEHVFRLTSPIRLLELANPSHPLLRRLQIEAPGTYAHSIMVGNLAESAAERIGADVLWVRVGSYYHDIGKIKRPYFFAENQFAQDNPHEKLNPSLSTLIIISHVKEGAELAREHGLPEKLIEIIEQHHGTDLIRYFYKRALESTPEERDALHEESFRYEGPKPQSKEAALIMLADSVEAGVRSLVKPNPSKLETVVQRIIRERLDAGQFDECSLTLKDLNNVKNSFLKVLSGLFHTRVEYPENLIQELEERKKHG